MFCYNVCIMSDTNTENTFNNEVDQSLAIAKSAIENPIAQDAQILQFPEQPATEQVNALVSDPEQSIVEPENGAESTSPLRKIAIAAGVGVAATAFLGGSIINAFSGDKEPVEPVSPKGVSELSQPYELGKESVEGDKVDTTSEVALLVTENIPGEQGGLDVVAQDIESRTDQNEQDSLSNTVWVPENADVNPAQAGVQLVEPTENKQ